MSKERFIILIQMLGYTYNPPISKFNGVECAHPTMPKIIFPGVNSVNYNKGYVISTYGVTPNFKTYDKALEWLQNV